jgi:hypothetical protein
VSGIGDDPKTQAAQVRVDARHNELLDSPLLRPEPRDQGLKLIVESHLGLDGSIEAGKCRPGRGIREKG